MLIAIGSAAPAGAESAVRHSGVLAFVRLTGTHWQVWERDFGTDQELQRTHSAFDKRYPVWGAEGELYFRSNNDELYRLGAADAEESPLLEEYWPAVGMVVEPRGERIAFARIRRDAPDMSAVVLIERPGGEGVFLTAANGFRRDLDWRDDGERIVFSVGGQEGAARIEEVVVATRESTVLADGPSRNVHPAYAPGGRELVFVSDRGGDFDLWIRDRGGRTKPLVALPGRQWGPAWSPDGQFVAFESQNGRVSEIWVVDRRGIGAKRLLDATSPAMDPAWRAARR